MGTRHRHGGHWREGLAALGIAAWILSQAMGSAFAKDVPPRVFKTPEAAVAALLQAARSGSAKALLATLGSQTQEWITSGDEVQDRLGLERFVTAFEAQHRLEKPSSDKALLSVGKDEFPFPFPIVKGAAGWAFDPEQGKEELLNRRIGRNELSTIQVMLAIVDAQREYASEDRNGNKVLEYAKKFRSDKARRDGLYWPTGENEDPSPLGELVAAAVEEGYDEPDRKAAGEESRPFHGYHFRLLTRQGPAARGGEMDYLVDGRLIGGFAVVAYPAKYGNSGIMSFMVNHEGVVYQANLGPETLSLVQEIEEFDPGEGWEEVRSDGTASRQ